MQTRELGLRWESGSLERIWRRIWSGRRRVRSLNLGKLGVRVLGICEDLVLVLGVGVRVGVGVGVVGEERD